MTPMWGCLHDDAKKTRSWRWHDGDKLLDVLEIYCGMCGTPLERRELVVENATRRA